MNFIKLDTKKEKKPQKDGWIAKIHAIINLLQLGGGMAMPKISGKIITFLLFLVIYFFITGIGVTIYWLIQIISVIFYKSS